LPRQQTEGERERENGRRKRQAARAHTRVEKPAVMTIMMMMTPIRAEWRLHARVSIGFHYSSSASCIEKREDEGGEAEDRRDPPLPAGSALSPEIRVTARVKILERRNFSSSRRDDRGMNHQ